MEIYKGKDGHFKFAGEATAGDFGLFFAMVIRERTSGIRGVGASVNEFYKAYADVISEDFQTVLDVATIADERPTARILEVLDVVELSTLDLCSHGRPKIIYTYVSKDYEST